MDTSLDTNNRCQAVKQIIREAICMQTSFETGPPATGINDRTFPPSCDIRFFGEAFSLE